MFKASLVYIVHSRPDRDKWRDSPTTCLRNGETAPSPKSKESRTIKNRINKFHLLLPKEPLLGAGITVYYHPWLKELLLEYSCSLKFLESGNM